MSVVTRVIIWFGAIPWVPRFLPLIVRIDRTVQRISGGRRSLQDLFGFPNLVLTVRGRRSGIARSTPLLCAPEDGRWLIAGSYFGGPDVPAWVGNLRAAGEAEVRIRGVRTAVVVRELHDEDRAQAWKALLAVWPNFTLYEQRSGRTIPVFELRPASTPT